MRFIQVFALLLAVVAMVGMFAAGDTSEIREWAALAVLGLLFLRMETK